MSLINSGLKLLFTPEDGSLSRQKSWIAKSLKKLGEAKLKRLIKEAVAIRKLADVKYSGYRVGCALLTKGGDIFASCNSEVASYTETEHAERSTISQAVAKGAIKKSGRSFIKVIVISHSGASGPCGGCRQRINEHCDNCLIVDTDAKGKIQAVTSLKTLLPYSFGPEDLS